MLTKEQYLNLAIVIKENLPQVGEIDLTGDLDAPIRALRDESDNLLETPSVETLALWCDAWQADQDNTPQPLSDAERIAQLEAQVQQLLTLLAKG